MSRLLSFRWGRAAALLPVFLLTAANLYGQASPDPPATRQGMGISNKELGQSSPSAQPSIVAEKRAFYVQGVVVAALFGGAIWAVSHSSRRV